MTTTRLKIEVDDLDRDAILRAVAKHQAVQRVGGEHILPDGEGALLGRILAEVCRGWCELIDVGRAP